jgi:hypothetical protein
MPAHFTTIVCAVALVQHVADREHPPGGFLFIG